MAANTAGTGTTKAKGTAARGKGTTRLATPKRLPRTATHGSRIIEALEAAWAEIRKNHPDVPAAVMITGSGDAQKGNAKGTIRLGHHWADRWVTNPKTSERAPELFIAGELLTGDAGRQVLETMLHEAAHATAHTRGIKDTSADGNRYHNKEFAKLATELGLQPPAKPAPTYGFSEATLTDETAARYAAVIAAIKKASLPYLDGVAVPGTTGGTTTGEGDGEEEGEGEGKKRGGKRRAVTCGCTPARRLQISPKQLEVGAIICGVCDQEFADRTSDDEEAAGEHEHDGDEEAEAE